MHLVSALLLGVSTNFDNLLIGVSYGVQNKRIPAWANVLIGALSAVVTYLICLFSARFSHFGRLPNLLGGGIIFLMGLYSVLPKRESAQVCGALGWRGTVLLGGALAINCIPVAFGAGLTGMVPWVAAVCVGSASILVVAIGNRIGLFTRLRVSARVLDVLGGGVMLVLGILQMLF